MKRFFTLLLASLLYAFVMNAQSVVVVDDDNHYDEFEPVVIALQTAGYTVDSLNLQYMDTLVYSDISNYDMVIWITGDDRVALNLWDTVSEPGTIKFHPALQQYYDNKDGAIWIDGIDFLKALVIHTDGSSADNDTMQSVLPVTFHAGDFVYDVLGIAEWNWDSKSMGDNGVPEADKTDENTITTLNTITWQWSTLWRADGWTPAGGTISLYNMGPSTYQGAGYSMFIKNENNGVKMYVSSLRLGKLGNGSSFDQAMVNSLVADVVADAVGGNSSVETKQVQLRVYPNPASDYVYVNGVDNGDLTISDMSGKVLISSRIAENTAIDISTLSAGVYMLKVKSAEGDYSVKLLVK